MRISSDSDALLQRRCLKSGFMTLNPTRTANFGTKTSG